MKKTTRIINYSLVYDKITITKNSTVRVYKFTTERYLKIKRILTGSPR
jgi:hypothetical protein